jgi:hypothetical protein
MDRQKIAKKIAKNIKELGLPKKAAHEKTIDLFGHSAEETHEEGTSASTKDLFGYDTADRAAANLPPVVSNQDAANNETPDLDSDLDQGAAANLNSDPKITGSGTGPTL